MKIVVFSYNRVPLKSNDVVEGTGLRYWRLALGFSNCQGVKATIAVLDRNRQSGSRDGIQVVSFSDDAESIKKIIISEKPDAIVASYWMSGIAKKILDNTPNKCLFIADAYSPFYVEFFAHSSSRLADKSIMKWHPEQLSECNYVIAGADFVLVASDKQEELYRGVLAALGFDPYGEDNRFVRVPGAVESSSPREDKPNKIDPTRKEILWFGGMYPWFNFSNLIDLFSNKDIYEIAYLRVVGGWNPMYEKNNKRYNGQYAKAHADAKKRGLINKSIYFEDWVSYGDRLGIFASADWAISINSTGSENAYSWRIRVADLAGNDVPVITNGGDPLGEWLINKGLAVRIGIGDDMKRSIKNVISDSELSSRIRTNLGKVHQDTHIYSYAEKLVGVLQSVKNPPRKLRQTGSVLETYENSSYIINEVNNKNLELEQNYISVKNELASARTYIDSLPRKLSAVFPYAYKVLIKRIRNYWAR